MNVVFAVCWNIEIDNYVHVRNIKAAAADNNATATKHFMCEQHSTD